jgi:hypothetical protein
MVGHEGSRFLDSQLVNKTKFNFVILASLSTSGTLFYHLPGRGFCLVTWGRVAAGALEKTSSAGLISSTFIASVILFAFLCKNDLRTCGIMASCCFKAIVLINAV